MLDSSPLPPKVASTTLLPHHKEIEGTGKHDHEHDVISQHDQELVPLDSTEIIKHPPN